MRLGSRPRARCQLRQPGPVKVRWADGAARVAWQGGGAVGKWRIVNGMFCSTYPELRGGAETCFISYRTGPKEWVTFTLDGSYNASSTDID